jgi:hypothetical protein
MVSSTIGARVGFCGREPSVGSLAAAAGEAAGGSVVSAMPWLDLLIALRSDQIQTDQYRRRRLEGVWNGARRGSREGIVAHASLISLDVADTLWTPYFAVTRGSRRTDPPCRCLGVDATRPSTDTVELTLGDLKNR